MSAYDNDPRVRPHPDGTWMVSSPLGEYNVAAHGDGTFNAFIAGEDRWLASVSGGDFDTVVHNLIGDPQ